MTLRLFELLAKYCPGRVSRSFDAVGESDICCAIRLNVSNILVSSFLRSFISTCRLYHTRKPSPSLAHTFHRPVVVSSVALCACAAVCCSSVFNYLAANVRMSNWTNCDWILFESNRNRSIHLFSCSSWRLQSWSLKTIFWIDWYYVWTDLCGEGRIQF